MLLIGPLGKLQWNLNRNSHIFIQEYASENVVWKMAAILSRPKCVNLSSKSGHFVSGSMCSSIQFMGLRRQTLLSGVPDYFGRNKISSGGDLSHYSSASLY